MLFSNNPTENMSDKPELRLWKHENIKNWETLKNVEIKNDEESYPWRTSIQKPPQIP